MAARLTNKWLKHAFPDDGPEREELLAEAAHQRREEVRRDTYLELSGADLRIRRHTGKNADDGPNGKAAKERALDDVMMLAVGSPEYQAAYDNELSFTIDGEELEITQGELYDKAKERAEDLQEQIAAAKRRGASADEIARMQATLDQVLIVRDNTNPQLGMMDEDRHRRVQDALNHPDSDTVLRNQMADDAAIEAEQDHSKTQETDKSARMDYDADTESVLMQWSGGTGRGSLASHIDGGADIVSATPLTAEFIQAAADEPSMPSVSDDQPATETLTNNSGFNLG